mmetsp:Transcript_9538/g.29595  ORF Transcript_9538/g.29595 Transcript_9538/m.29595 type:complete len:86 (-) Transcript_9538:1088-1345(-)
MNEYLFRGRSGRAAHTSMNEYLYDGDDVGSYGDDDASSSEANGARTPAAPRLEEPGAPSAAWRRALLDVETLQRFARLHAVGAAP